MFSKEIMVVTCALNFLGIAAVARFMGVDVGTYALVIICVALALGVVEAELLAGVVARLLGKEPKPDWKFAGAIAAITGILAIGIFIYIQYDAKQSAEAERKRQEASDEMRRLTQGASQGVDRFRELQALHDAEKASQPSP